MGRFGGKKSDFCWEKGGNVVISPYTARIDGDLRISPVMGKSRMAGRFYQG